MILNPPKSGCANCRSTHSFVFPFAVAISFALRALLSMSLSFGLAFSFPAIAFAFAFATVPVPCGHSAARSTREACAAEAASLASLGQRVHIHRVILRNLEVRHLHPRTSSRLYVAGHFHPHRVVIRELGGIQSEVAL
eukprot:2160049-Amphidinium_carterae.1